MTIFESAIANSLKETLNMIIDDDTDGYFESMDLHDWCEEGSMKDAYYDDQEMGGPGLASEKTEGAPMAMGSVREGATFRYQARTFALRMGVTEEAMEDNKYPKSLNLARRLKRAMAKTADIDATNILNRMFNTSYVGGDGVCLGSNAHTLPGGGTYSNIMATPFSPSVQAVAIARAQVRLMPGHDGTTEGYTLKKILAPVAQEEVWERILYSKMDPAAGNFSAINVVNQRMKLDLKVLKHWNASTTNWAALTDVEDERPRFYWRRKPRSKTWVENNEEVMIHAVSSRWARGWSGGRGIFAVNA